MVLKNLVIKIIAFYFIILSLSHLLSVFRFAWRDIPFYYIYFTFISDTVFTHSMSNLFRLFTVYSIFLWIILAIGLLTGYQLLRQTKSGLYLAIFLQIVGLIFIATKAAYSPGIFSYIMSVFRGLVSGNFVWMASSFDVLFSAFIPIYLFINRKRFNGFIKLGFGNEFLNQQHPVKQSLEQKISGQVSVPPEFNNINNPSTGSTKPIWQTDVFIVLLIVLFWPVGLILMWKYASWRKLIKTLLTIFFSLSVILPFIVAISFLMIIPKQLTTGNSYNSSQLNKNSEYEKTYQFEDLKNGFIRVQSKKYNGFSFEFPDYIKYVFPKSGRDDQIGFGTDESLKNDNLDTFMRFAIMRFNIIKVYGNDINDKDDETAIKETLKLNPELIRYNLNGMSTLKNKSGNDVLIYYKGYVYKFSYGFLYGPLLRPTLTEEENRREKETFEYMIKTFKVEN